MRGSKFQEIMSNMPLQALRKGSFVWIFAILGSVETAFAISIVNAICKRILALMHQTSPASGLANTDYCKNFCNSALGCICLKVKYNGWKTLKRK